MQDSARPDQDAARLRSEVSLKWAFDAYDRFAARLSPEVRRHLGARRKDAYTVVFGRTQVGKSTLIMHLLGVRTNAMELILRVLRGGRKSGSSSTALPTEYRRARDDCWRIRWGGRVWLCDSADEACDNFRKARETMEADAVLPAESLCEVEIPACYFDAALSDVRGTRVLDLPGMDAANAIERRFVTRVAESLVPNADMVLLVGRADDLTFLMPDQLALPGVSDWQISPRRFRVVTTYSFTPASIREFVREHGCMGDVGKYRERLIGEIQRFRPLEPSAQAPELYFPLEFGDSWKGACDLHSSEMDEMMDGLMQGLRQDIAAASTPIGRLEGALDAHVHVSAVHARRLAEIETEEKRLQQAMQEREGVLGQLEKTLEIQRERLNARLAELDALTDVAIARGAAAVGDAFHKMASERWWSVMEQQARRLKGPDRNTDFLLSMLAEAEASLGWQIPKAVHTALAGDRGEKPTEHGISGYGDMVERPARVLSTFWKKVQESAGRLDAVKVSKVADQAFSEVRSMLERYWIKYYVRDQAYEQDLAQMTAAHDRLSNDISVQVTLDITARAEAAKHEMQDDSHRLEMRIIDTKQLMAFERSVLARFQTQLEDCQALRDEAERFIREEVALSQQFTRLLAEEYDKAVETAHTDFMDATDPTTAFELLVMASMLRESHESVWTRISGAVKQ